MPYAAERYRYNWGAMLFTAIGFHKPVLASQELNPEVFEDFNIGVTLSSLDELSIIDSMEQLITLIAEQTDIVSKELERANVVYGHEQLVKRILQ